MRDARHGRNHPELEYGHELCAMAETLEALTKTP
jgi:hypothetical protein